MFLFFLIVREEPYCEYFIVSGEPFPEEMGGWVLKNLYEEMAVVFEVFGLGEEVDAGGAHFVDEFSHGLARDGLETGLADLEHLILVQKVALDLQNQNQDVLQRRTRIRCVLLLTIMCEWLLLVVHVRQKLEQR